MVKYVADIISQHLSTLFNLSVKDCVYPDIFKTAKCVPLFKGGDLDPQKPVSYRPIAILNSINKVFERLLHDQIYRYVEINKLLPSFQYGYRRRHNTSQAILDYSQTIYNNLKNKLTTIAVFMDLSKAFDTVDKDILSSKLADLGFDISSQNLIYDYMTNRDFCFGEAPAERYKLNYGVPQGSILGPLLFILYIYDMKYICPFDKVIVYADDTTILISGRNIEEATQRCNDILERFLNYFNCNKLSINPDKTKYILYKPKKQKHTVYTHNSIVSMNNIKLEKVYSIRFLGVIINSKLTWEEHKQFVKRKVSKTLGILYRCRNIMNENELINLYKTFIQSNLLYAIEVWGHTVTSPTDILAKIQNKSLRILFDCKRSDDAWRYSNRRIKSVEELYRTTIIRVCMKHQYNQLPDYFSTNMMPHKTNYEDIQSKGYSLRSNLEQHYNYKNNIESKAPFIENCISIWNNSPIDSKTKTLY